MRLYAPMAMQCCYIFKLHSGTVVCSAHFRKDAFVFKGHTSKTTLKEDAVPTTFDWQTNPKERKDRVTAAEM